MSDVFVFDTRGIGSRFDPLHGRESEDELRKAADYLLAEPHEGHGLIFTKRAVKMLTQLFKAARIEGHPPLSYAGHFIHLGITDAARRLEELSIRESLPPKDNLATRFLDVAFQDADFESRFLQDAWSTLTGKIEPVITETILKSVAGADFSPADIICATHASSILTSADHPIRARESRSVLRLMPNVRQTAALVAPPSSTAITAASFSASMAMGRPPWRPRRRAAASPAWTRSWISDRSN